MPRRQAPLHLERPGAPDIDGLYLALVTNTRPWTYLGDRPLNPTPDASFETGLDVYARSSMGALSMARGFAQIARMHSRPRGRSVSVLHDLNAFVLHSDRPLPFQVDGDYLGERTSVAFSAHPAAIVVAC
jgi:diacylglycerol kinase family enzyme